MQKLFLSVLKFQYIIELYTGYDTSFLRIGVLTPTKIIMALSPTALGSKSKGYNSH